MKKLLFVLGSLTLILVTGCNMNNTPTKKVEEYLNSYKTLDDGVTDQIDEIIKNDNNMTEEQKNDYESAIKRQYKDLIYTIKDETIDGDNAIVKVEIEVYDFYQSNLEVDKYYQENPEEFTKEDNVTNEELLIDKRIKALSETNERVKYTIDINLTKEDNNWSIEEPDSITIQKIHGLYVH